MNIAKPPAPSVIRAWIKHAMVYLSYACNLRCRYCFETKVSHRTTPDTARKMVDFLFLRSVSGMESTINLTFFGGEPFMEMDLMELIIDYCRKQGPNAYKKALFSATTNGTIANARVERIVQDAQMRLLVSMDGGQDASTYRPYVSGKSSYETVARNLSRLASWGVHTMVRMTFHPGALDLVGNVRQVLSLGAPSIALCPVAEAAWTGHEDILDAAYQELADWYIAEARQGRIVPLDVTHMMVKEWHHHQQGGPRPARPCAVGHSLVGIDPDGNVMPCHRFLYRKHDWLGTVDDQRIDATRRAPYLQLDSRRMLGCDTCAAEPVCGGGCRAVAVTAGLDLQTGTHPGFCLTTRAHARAARRIYDTLMAESNAAFLATVRGGRPLLPAFNELISN